MNDSLDDTVTYVARRHPFSALSAVGLAFVLIPLFGAVRGILDGSISLVLVTAPLYLVGIAIIGATFLRRGRMVLRASSRGLEIGPFHDVLIPWSGLLELRIDRLTANGSQFVVRFVEGSAIPHRDRHLPSRPIGHRPRVQPLGPPCVDLGVRLDGWTLDRVALYEVVRFHAPHTRRLFGGGPPFP